MAVVLILLFLAAYALTLVMPSWRWLLVYVVAVGGLLGAWFAAIVTTPPR
jgi:hypothetical protein